MLGDFIWMDWNMRYFIFTGRSMDKGRPHTHMLWSQYDYASNSESNMVELNIPYPTAAEIYYIACGQIDRQNRCRQESLDIQNKLGKKYWLKQFNLSIFAINVVNVWLAHQGITRISDI